MGDFLREQGVAEPEIQACELALVEACNNAIHYTAEPGQPIEVDAVCSANHIELRVSDHTKGFEWPKEINLPAPDQETGRGLYLIQMLMDTVSYLRGDSRNCLIMRKLRGPGRLFSAAGANVNLDEANQKLVESEKIIGDMAEELSSCYESLSAIFRCSTELGRKNDLEEFSQRLLTDLSQITSAEWFVLRILTKGDSRLVVFTASEPRFQLVPLSLNSISDSAELEAALTRQDVWFDEHRPLDSTDPLASVKPDSIGLVHPFFFGDTLIGTLTVGKTGSTPNFTAVHANVVHTFTDFLAIQIVNTRFQEEQVASRLVSRDLEIARNIQRSLLPKSLPSLPGYSVAGFCESARQVGGDFYDVLRISDHSLLLIIADVMGKGIPAAIFAAILRSLLRVAPEWTNEPAALLSRVNRLLYDELSGVDMFITAQLVFVDTRERRIVAASAGHCPIIIAAESDEVKTLSPEGLPLGILPDTTYSNEVERLARNHRVLLYTDGLTEARNAHGEFFGQDRLIAWFTESLQKNRSAEELKEHLAAKLAEFQQDAVLNDDQTFLIMAQ